MNKITYTSLDERRKDLNSRSLSHEIFRENLAKELTTEKSSDPTRARELLESIKTSPNYIRSKFGYTQKGIDAFLTTCTDEEIKKECTSFNTVWWSELGRAFQAMKSRNEKVDEKTAILLLKHGQYGLVCRNFDYFHIEDKSNFLKQTLKAGIRGKHSLHITKNLVTKNTEHYHTIVKTERRIEESITGIIRQLASTANKEEKECLREIFMNQGRMSICSKHTIDEIFGE